MRKTTDWLVESNQKVFCLAGALAILGCSSPATQIASDIPITFENSGAPEAQPHFLYGVFQLHNFEYESAARAFRQAQEIDQNFALAYWGEAQTFNHPIWMEQDRDAAITVLNRLAPTPAARAAKAHTAKEQAWLNAIEILYGTDPNAPASKDERDDLYRATMQVMSEAYPNDHEVASFYGLSVLGTAHEGRDFDLYAEAASIVDPVFRANPQHPGAVHYLIHSFDDPIHAPRGLPMARAYASIAPEAGHAQHMTSHIFVAMGMWDDVISANVAARDAQTASLAELGDSPRVCGHYTYWLEYGYLQAGQFEDAQRVLDQCFNRVNENATSDERRYFALMRARWVVDTERWSDADRYTLSNSSDADYRFVTALAALRLGRHDEARREHQSLNNTLSQGTEPSNERVLELLLRSQLLQVEQKGDSAISTLRQAVAMESSLPFEFGPPAIVMPPGEALGGLLLEMSKYGDAVNAFETQLGRTPNRTSSLVGAMLSHRALGHGEQSQALTRKLLEIWHTADQGIPMVETTRGVTGPPGAR